MSERTRGFLPAVAAVVLLGGMAYAGWHWGGEALFGGDGLSGSPTEPGTEVTPQLADEALVAIESFRSDPDATRMALGAAEVASLVRYSAPGVLPEGVTAPDVEFRSDRVYVWSRVAVAAFPTVPEVERIVGVLPDTAPVEVRGSVLPYEEGGAAFRVERIRVSDIPLPRTLTPRLLELLGRRDRPGLPPDAMSLPLPAAVATAYILSDSLVLVAPREE